MITPIILFSGMAKGLVLPEAIRIILSLETDNLINH